LLQDYGFTVKLVNARHVKHVPGRKSDVQDCQWLQQLESFGLLIRSAARPVQQMQKALAQMNLKLQHVLSDITGVTGMAIIRAILRGEREPLKLAALKDRRIKSDTSTIAKSLEGDYRAEHLFVLRQALELYDYYQQQIAECDAQIYEEMKKLESNSEAVPSTSQRKRSCHNPFHFNAQSELQRVLGVDLTRINGISETTAQLILSELGSKVVTTWPSEAHFASWLGLCPNNEISGGKVLRRGTRKVVNRVANALRMCAESLLQSKSALGAYARRMRSRRDTRIAITATAHKLARLVYRTLKYGEEYVDQGQQLYEQQYQAAVLKSLNRTARKLGYELVTRQPPPS
jgi:transposase